MVSGGGSWVGEDHQGDALDHLHVSAQAVARLPTEERLRHVRADRWIGYSRATAALERLDTLYAWPGKQRMPNLLLIGPTNNGKSMIIEKFRRLHPPTSHADREQMPVLAVQMPSDPSVIRFYVALLAALGAPLRPRQRLAELEQATLTLLRAVGVRVLVIDELHNLLAGRGETRREFLNLISKGVPYVEVNITENPDAREYVTEELGYTVAPVVVVDDDDHWCDLRPDHIERVAAHFAA